jgi:Domain of unknown function (DUF1877)
MSVLTHFYRVSGETLKKLEANPTLMDLLLGCSEIVSSPGEKQIFCNGSVLRQLNIDKAWDDILIILCRTDHEDACRTLDVPLWEEFDGFEEIRLFSPAQVSDGVRILKNLKIENLRAEALRRGLQTYSGDPIEYLLDYALGHLETLVNFWREAAEAGEGIVSSTG